jgi:hypothetical protein
MFQEETTNGEPMDTDKKEPVKTEPPKEEPIETEQAKPAAEKTGLEIFMARSVTCI